MNGKAITDDVKRVFGVEELEKPGLLGLDIGVYEPFAKTIAKEGVPDLRAGLAESYTTKPKMFEDTVLNHRYPNGRYVTLSQKHGRRISQAGYFLNDTIEELNKKKWLFINYKAGAAGLDAAWNIAIPISVCLSKERPAAGITVRLGLKRGVTIMVYNAVYDGGWKDTRYEWNLPKEQDENILVYEKTIDIPSWRYNEMVFY